MSLCYDKTNNIQLNVILDSTNNILQYCNCQEAILDFQVYKILLMLLKLLSKTKMIQKDCTVLCTFTFYK